MSTVEEAETGVEKFNRYVSLYHLSAIFMITVCFGIKIGGEKIYMFFQLTKTCNVVNHCFLFSLIL